jgi:predicted metal-dependent peptidase
MGACVVAIDTSGSIGQDELEAFVTELKGLLEQARPRELWVAWWDTSCVMQRIDNMDEFDPDELHPTGGGGTDYSCVEPAIADEYLDPEIVVALTDGHVGWPADFPWPHITLSTGRVDCPFGRTIKMDLAHDYV